MNKNVLKFVLSLKIRRLRNRKGLSLKDLAEKSGLSHSYLNEIEKGKKYPKVEKLLNLADALDVDVDELVSAKMGKQLHPLLTFLESDLATNLPLSAFGIGEQDIYDLMSHSPEKFTSFLMTVAELAKSYDISLDDLNKAALRAYIEVNGNYFPYLEELGSSYSRQIKDLLKGQSSTDIIQKLTIKLKNEFNVDVDRQTLGSGTKPLGLKSIYRDRDNKKVLFVNCNLGEKQVIYCLVKELGAQQLVSDDSHKKRDPLNVQFPDLLLEFQTHYFAGATLLPENDLVEDLKHFFEFANFNEAQLISLMKNSLVPPEVFMGRLTQILPHHFDFNQLFWLRCNEDLIKNPGSYFISQELHLGQLHHPHGVSLRERYCRRWITIELLKNLAETNESENKDFHVGAQVSQMGEGGSPYLCISLASPRSTADGVNSCLTLGLALDDNFKSKVNFSEDQNIERKVVGRTCERCSLSDCEERAAAPSIYMREVLAKEKLESIRTIMDS